MCLWVYKILEGLLSLCVALLRKFTSQTQLELFRLLLCLKGEQSAEVPCATIQVLSLAQTRRRTLSTFLIRLPVFEQRGCLHTGIIEEIMQYLHFLLPGSFQVFTAVQAQLSRREMTKKKKRGKKEITKPISSTDTKLAMSLWGRMALVVLTRETPCVFDPNSEKQKKKKKKAGFFFFLDGLQRHD